MAAELEKSGKRHRWTFFRAGGFDQVRLERPEDLQALDRLDQKLWVALACPVSGLELEAATLKLIDTDNDGRIRAAEVLAAVKWALARLKDPGDLMKGSASLPLSAIDESTPAGAQVLASAREILQALGKPQAKEICPEDTASTTRIFEKTNFNGDGVVPARAADDEKTSGAIEDIMAAVGSAPDRCGLPGLNRELLEKFFKEAAAFSDWQAETEKNKALLPLGDRTGAALDAVETVSAKLEDYFVRCRLAAFDQRAAAGLNRDEKEYAALGAKELSPDAPDIAALPLARIEAGRALPLRQGLNPAWAARLEKFYAQAVVPLLGERAELAEADWQKLRASLAGHAQWRKTKPAGEVERLGLARVRELLDPSVRKAIERLIEKDLATSAQFDALTEVDRLVRYFRDLFRLLCNFVSFQDFYGRRKKSIFQAGTLYLDQRACDLCVKVDDAGKHASLARLSQTYLLYCECVRRGSGEKMSIAAAMTAGGADNLMVGRNGIFYDRQGRDWDATVLHIVENPVSIGQAFWSPYKRLVRWVNDMVAKRAAAADAAAHEKTTVIVAGAAGGEPAKGPPPKPKIDIGTVAALGVAVGGITAALGALLQAFFGLGIWMPIGLLGLILTISVPSMIIAWLKLRQRNLGPILDACGWAVNTRALINLPFGRSLTSQARLPRGTRREKFDPFKERHGRRNFLVIVLIILALAAIWFFGVLDRILPEPVRSTAVLGSMAPAAETAPPTDGATEEKPSAAAE